jgi:hypothetical protein
VSIRIATDRLLDLLADLAPTATGKTGMRGILLHTARGYYGDDPGMTTLLVGMGASGRVVGHTYIPCDGTLEPTLLGIADVASIRGLLETRAKADPNHSVEVTRDLETVTFQEPPDLFASGNSVTLHVGDLDTVPRYAWKILGYDHPAEQMPPPTLRGEDMPAVPRSDYDPAQLAPFITVAKRHTLPVQVYRYHPHRPTLVQIGGRYRGAIMPTRWAADMSRETIHREGAAPDGDLYEPDLPPVKNPGGGGGFGVVIDFRRKGEQGDGQTELPIGEVDPAEETPDDDTPTDPDPDPGPVGKPAPPTFDTATP